MTSLPSEVPPRYPYVANAYNMCLRLEKSLQEAANEGQNVGKDLIYIRILGFLFHHVPTDEGLKTIINEVCSTAGNSALLLQVGKMYFDHFIRPFKANKDRTPTSSSQSSRLSFDTMADMINYALEETSQSHATAKKKALIRDGYRCVVTNRYDQDSVTKIQELADIVKANDDLRTISTHCAYIFPNSEATNLSIEPGSSKHYNAASLWAVMERFGLKKNPDELNGSESKNHRLENVMTVAVDFQNQFDQLKVWFVPTNEENKYKLESPLVGFLRGYHEYVTFTTSDPIKYPVPSRTYLEIHAACAKVAHLSGAGEYIDKLYEEMEDRQTLDSDGGSADMLEHVIFGLKI